jgi:hypothetical protein
MQPAVATNDPVAVEKAVQAAYLAMFPEGDKGFVTATFAWWLDCFSGRHSGYLPIDAKYHDLEHTLQGTLCLARLLAGRQAAAANPKLTQRMFELGLTAGLLHDSGYLKKRGDTNGTGAKYTVVHVARSVDFAGEILKQNGLPGDEILAVQNMIFCTGVDAPLERIPFQDDLEKTTGFALGTADLLGQMAAGDYVEKLSVLYDELSEASRSDNARGGSVGAFASAEELRRGTPSFWEKYVRPKLERDFGGLYAYLNDPYPSGPNLYLDHIEANMDQLRKRHPDTQPAAR